MRSFKKNYVTFKIEKFLSFLSVSSISSLNISAVYMYNGGSRRKSDRGSILQLWAWWEWWEWWVWLA